MRRILASRNCCIFLLCILNVFFNLADGHGTHTSDHPVPTPTAKFTPGPEVSLDRFFTIENHLLSAPAGIPGGDCTVPTNLLVPNRSVTVILPPPISENNTQSFESMHAKALKISLPYLLEQIGVSTEKIPKLTSRGIPLFEAAIKESLCPSKSGSHHRRNIFDDIGDFVGDVVDAVVGGVVGAAADVGCGIFAAGVLPGFHVVAASLHNLNLGRTLRATTPDQDFYIFPVHGPISHNDGIVVIYNATLPRGFGDSNGVTIGRRIYVRSSANTRFAEHPNFPSATHLLVHEFTHSKQYQALSYDLSAFGTKYLFNYCKAGFSYTNNPMEVEARRKADSINDLLTNAIGSQFVKIWKRRNLRLTSGFPVAKSFRSFIGSPANSIFSLALQRGSMFIFCSGGVCT